MTDVSKYVTNTDSNVFALRNLPQVVCGALLSRYSRSELGLRELLSAEFLDKNFEGHTPVETDSQIANKKAEEFYDRVLLGYGDDSVAELGGAHLACEQISNIAAKEIEDSRLGISPLEKSTRYVRFDIKVAGQYQYYQAEVGKHKALYKATLDNLFDTYSELIEPLSLWLSQEYPKDKSTTDRAYKSTIKAKALDLLRGLLPMATLTNVGMLGNGRAYDYLITKLAASSHKESNLLSNQIQDELDKVIPSFVKKAKSERGAATVDRMKSNQKGVYDYFKDNKTYLEAYADSYESLTFKDDKNVTLCTYPDWPLQEVGAQIIYKHHRCTMQKAMAIADVMDIDDLKELIDTYIGERVTRFDKPGRAFESVQYTFDIKSDIGAYRDLQRHRVCTQERQDYTIDLGYVTPIEIKLAGLADLYESALSKAATAYQIIYQNYPLESQYLVPMIYNIRYKLQMNLREVYHFVELRSGRQGHSGYRKIAQEMYRAIEIVHPSIAKGMKFVDLNDYSLERLAAEQKQDLKAN